MGLHAPDALAGPVAWRPLDTRKLMIMPGNNHNNDNNNNNNDDNNN